MFRSVISIAFIATYIVGLSQNFAEKLDMQNIVGVEFTYSGQIFDADYTRENYSPFESCKSVVFDERKDIEYFCSLLDSLKFVSTLGLNEYSDGSWIHSIPVPQSSKFTNILPDPQLEVFGNAKLFYKNGRMPMLIWIGPAVIINGTYYKASIDLSEKLYDFRPSGKPKSIISDWQSAPVDCSSITAIKILALPEEPPTPISRVNFVSRLYNQYFTLRRHVIHDNDKSEFMNTLRDLEFKRSLPYDADSPAQQSHIDRNGDLVWSDIADPVIGLIMIYRKEGNNPEFIWVTESGLDRGYSSFHRSDRINELLRIKS